MKLLEEIKSKAEAALQFDPDNKWSLDVSMSRSDFEGFMDAEVKHIAFMDPRKVLSMVRVIEEAECTQEGNDYRSDLYKAIKDLEKLGGGDA